MRVPRLRRLHVQFAVLYRLPTPVNQTCKFLVAYRKSHSISRRTCATGSRGCKSWIQYAYISSSHATALFLFILHSFSSDSAMSTCAWTWVCPSPGPFPPLRLPPCARRCPQRLIRLHDHLYLERGACVPVCVCVCMCMYVCVYVCVCMCVYLC